VAAAMTVATLTLSTPAASAEEKIPEKTIKSECKEAGGTYSTTVEGGTRQSSCAYKDIKGDGWIDLYTNGKYVGTG
jgi:hypothetical protein